MAIKMDERLKEQAIDNMTKNLTVLRTMRHLSQAELAELIGMGRQNLVSIENGKRRMTWSTFLSLLFVFSQNKDTNDLLQVFGILSKELMDVYAESTHKD